MNIIWGAFKKSNSLGLRLVLGLWFWKLSRWFRGAAWRRTIEVERRLSLPAEGPLLFWPRIPQLPMSSRNRWGRFVADVTGPLRASCNNDLSPWVSLVETPRVCKEPQVCSWGTYSCSMAWLGSWDFFFISYLPPLDNLCLISCVPPSIPVEGEVLGGCSRKLWHSLSTLDLELGDQGKKIVIGRRESTLKVQAHLASLP